MTGLKISGAITGYFLLASLVVACSPKSFDAREAFQVDHRTYSLRSENRIEFPGRIFIQNDPPSSKCAFEGACFEI